MGAHGARVVGIMIFEDLLHDPCQHVNIHSQTLEYLRPQWRFATHQVLLDFAPKQVELHQAQLSAPVFLESVKVDSNKMNIHLNDLNVCRGYI